jgi:hypothetical protein
MITDAPMPSERAQERTAENGSRTPRICRSFRARSIFYAFPGAPLRSTPGYRPGAPSALKSNCLNTIKPVSELAEPIPKSPYPPIACYLTLLFED